jgi:hypothetical protein
VEKLDDMTMLGHILEGANDQVRSLFELVEQIQANFQDQLSGLRDDREISILTPDLRSRLAVDRALVAGAGIVLSEQAVSGVNRFMEWWAVSREDSRQPHRLQVSIDPESVSFYDYVDADWYVSALEVGGPTIVGPYVDALGTDENVITLAAPLGEDSGPLGVASLDIRADEFSIRLGNQLRKLDARTALINTERRVIASTSVEHLPGSLLPENVRTERHEGITGWQSVVF